MSTSKLNKLALALLTFTTISIASCAPSLEKHEQEQICAYCGKCIDEECKCKEKCVCESLVVTKDTFTMYENTIWATPGYLFKTNKEGPGIVIIGGIHGDEIAGWNAATELVSCLEQERKLCGNILIVPKVNKLADDREERFVGKIPGESNNVVKSVTIEGVTDKYSDLNRSFELGRYTSATTRSIWLSDQIVSLVKDFDTKYGADYIIDLHEAKSSWITSTPEDGSLGDTLVFSNKALLCRKILKNYNENYRYPGEIEFGSDVASQRGSFSYNMTNLYPNSVVFTIETNRNFEWTSKSTGYNKIALEVRVRQQLNMLRSCFDYAWERI